MPWYVLDVFVVFVPILLAAPSRKNENNTLIELVTLAVVTEDGNGNSASMPQEVKENSDQNKHNNNHLELQKIVSEEKPAICIQQETQSPSPQV